MTLVQPYDDRCGVIACDSLDGFELAGDNTAAGVSTCVRREHAPLTMALTRS